MPVIKAEKLEGECARIFVGAGLSDQEARQVAHSLVLANLMGHDSHGAIRVAQYLEALEDGRVKAGQQLQIVRQAKASAVVDGGLGFGQTVCHQAMKLAMDKARDHSVAAVELGNSSHIGRLGEYVEVAAGADMIGMVMCNNHGGGLWQPPFGGIDARMSPNPIAVGFPTGREFPIVVDMTTSVVAEGKVRVKRNQGESLPEGWILDAEGNPTTDPAALYGPPRGAILPFGGIAGHKGYALSVMVDILSGALGGAGCSRDASIKGGRNGVFLMAIDIAAFTGTDQFQEEVETFIDYLKSSRLMPGFDEIALPGELEYRMRRQREKEGLFIDDETWRQICAAGQTVGIEVEA